MRKVADWLTEAQEADLRGVADHVGVRPTIVDEDTGEESQTELFVVDLRTDEQLADVQEILGDAFRVEESAVYPAEIQTRQYHVFHAEE